MDHDEFPIHVLADFVAKHNGGKEQWDAINRIRGAQADNLTTLHQIQELEGSSLWPQNETVETMAGMAKTMLVKYTPCPEARKQYMEDPNKG